MNFRSLALFLVTCPWLLSAGIATAQTGTGLTGKYYDTETFGSLMTTRTDATVNFSFGSAIPSGTAVTAATTYSVAWSGQIEPQFSELYTFTVTADDAARLWVDNQMIVGRTFYQAPGELRGQIRLKAGQRVNLRLEYIQQSGPASVKLEWASASQPKQIVPAVRLYPTTEIPNGGSLMREVWTGLAGNSLATLTSNANYPNKPASRDFITSFECIARDWENSFGTRVTGFIRPPVSGSYTFAVSGDDVVQLYLSTDATSANKSLIASVASATSFRQWDAQPSQQSTARTLVAGQRYYVEVLHKEDSGTDHWSVGWKLPGSAAFSVIPGTALMMPGTDTAQPSTANFFNTLATEQPRLGVSRERFLWLKQQYLSPTASNAKSRAQAVINTATGELNAALVTQRQAQDRIQRLALAWWLTGDNQYAEAAWNNINNAITNGSWTDPWKGVENGVIAIGYDWLYPYWSQTRKDAMVSCMVNKGFNPGWTDSYGNNIGVIINAGHLMAMLAVGTANESAAENRMGTAISRLSSRIEKWNSNAGAWYEGTDYGIFTKWNFGQAMPSIECALGSSFGLSRVAGVSFAAREPLTIASNTRQRFTFSDVGTGSEAAIGWANWWARRFNALETFDYSRQIGNSPLNALTLPETTISPAAAGLNPDTAYRGPVDSTNKLFQEVVTLRENWTDSKATFVGGMGGTYYDHGMLQSGTFQLCARGVKWFQDLSSESYDVPNHNTTTPNPNGRDRWDYYRNRAEGHNTIVINPSSGPDRIWNAPYAPLLQYQSAQNGQRSFAVWDLSKNITSVTKVQRGLQLLNKRRDVLIQDEIVLPAAGTAWWFAHFNNTNTTATIGPDGSSVTLQQGSERLWGKIVSGGGVWTVRAAQPLPTSPAPPEAYTNSTYSKLAINLTGVTNTTLAVWFVPLAPGESPPATAPTITPLASWNLVAQNEAPVASHGSANTAGGSPVDVALSSFTTDDWTPSSQLTYAVSSPVGGTVSLLPDGITARFTPTSGFTGLQSFAFTATDADGATSNTGKITFSAPPVITNWTSTVSGNWSVGTNWQSSTAPIGGLGADIQFFNGQSLAAGTITATNNLAGVTDANKLNFSGTGTATTVVNVGGNALRLVRNGILSPAITLSGTTTGYRYNIANDITLNDDVIFNGSGSGTFVFNGAITGSGGITRTGTSSTLILAGNNSYAGSTSINAGTLQIGNDGATGSLGNGPVTIASGATLRFDRTGSVLVSNDITGAGRVIVNGATSSDVVSFSGDNDFTGEVRVENGSLRVSDASQLGSGTKTISIISTTTALLRLDGSSAPVVFPPEYSVVTSNPNGAILNEAGDNEILGNLTLGSGGGGTRITVAAGSLTIGGTITSNYSSRTLDLRGAGNGIINGNFIDGTDVITGFTKNDAGTWTLNGNNAISSATTISAGKLVINGSHASGTVSVASGATLSGRGSLTAATTVTGTLAPGDGIGTMNFGSTISFGSTSKLQWEIESNTSVADQAIAAGTISVYGGAKIDLVLNRPGSTVNLLNSFWRNARTFPVITGSSLSGAFSIGTITTDAGGRPVSTYGSFTLQTTATGTNLVWTPIPGFPIYNDPVVTITSPASQPVSIIDAEHELHVSATSDGGPSAPMLWSTVSGPEAVDFDNPAAATTRVHFTEAGSYVLRCTAFNAGGSGSRDFTVEVAPAATELSLREGVNSVSTPATFIRGDSSTWNSGARDQIIVGRNAGSGYRGLLSFPIPPELNGSVITGTSLNLTVASGGSGTALGTLEIRRLSGTFTEGSGDGSVATNGAGTGADWLNRSYTPATPWALAGGGSGTDYETTTLSTAAGFNPTTTPGGTAVGFDSTPDFITAVSNAASTSQPLGLFLKMVDDTSAGALFARFASDDHATLDWRPELQVAHYPHLAPILDPGTITTAATGTAVTLTGVSTNGTPSGWTYVSGPASPVFLTSTNTSANLLFTQPGSHFLRFTGTNTHGESSRLLAIEVTGNALTGLDLWRLTHFGTIENTGTAADLGDFDNDGIANILEYVLNGNPNVSGTAILPTLDASGPNFIFTFTRREPSATDTTQVFQYGSALNGWTALNITAPADSAVTLGVPVGGLQTVTISIPKTLATGGKLFGRLRVSQP